MKLNQESSGWTAAPQYLDEVDWLMNACIMAGATNDVRAWWRAVDQLMILVKWKIKEDQLAEFVALEAKMDGLAASLWHARWLHARQTRWDLQQRAKSDSEAYMALRVVQKDLYGMIGHLLMPSRGSKNSDALFKQMDVKR